MLSLLLLGSRGYTATGTGDNTVGPTAALNEAPESGPSVLRAHKNTSLLPPPRVLGGSDFRCGLPRAILETLPIPKRCTKKRDRPLIIVAGEGKTGTESLATALGMMGLKVAHFKSFIQCCKVKETTFDPEAVAEAAPTILQQMGVAKEFIPAASKLLESVLSTNKPFNFCDTNPRGDRKTCTGVSWTDAYRPYYHIAEKLYRLPIEDYDTFDWCLFDDFDVIADVPIPQLSPFIYSAYGPGTRVIQTVRDVGDWAARRAGWDYAHHLNDTAPLGEFFSKSLSDATDPDSLTNVATQFNASKSAATYAYLAELTMLQCIVSTDDLLTIDIITSAQSEPERLWTQLASFLDTSLDGLDIKSFPLEIPGVCHSANTVATYQLKLDDFTKSPWSNGTDAYKNPLPALTYNSSVGDNIYHYFNVYDRAKQCNSSQANSRGSVDSGTIFAPSKASHKP